MKINKWGSNMKRRVLKNQISIFEYLESIKEKPVIELNKPKVISGSKNLIEKYKDKADRIVRTVSGAVKIDISGKTIYYNKSGIKEFEKEGTTPLLPADVILIANKDFGTNDIQLEKLKKFNVSSYIKRKGDRNILIIMENKTIAINPNGWVLEYRMKPNYKETEIIEIEQYSNTDEIFKVGDKVTTKYKEETVKGIVTRIYNNGETLNISWNNKNTAFYYKNVKGEVC